MKKIVLSLAVMFTIGASAVFANNSPEANPKALEVFKKEFSTAQNVKWSVEGNYSKASFILGGNRAIAVFTSDGELLGSVRDIVYNQLPLPVMTSLDKRFASSAIFELREVINSEGTRYKFILEQKSKKYAVSVFPDGSVETISRVKNQ